MFPPCEEMTYDIMSFRKPTMVDKVAEGIRKPEGAIPNFGLPKWKVMPLESKIPMVPGPEGSYNFTRQKLGKRLWISLADAEFNLSDPNCYEMKLPYDALHDKHLVEFFSKKSNIQHLLKTGLITKNLDVKCSLRDYNVYRTYLKKLYANRIKKELRRRARLFKEEFIKNPPYKTEMDEKIQKKRELEAKNKKNKERVESEREKRIQHYKDIQEKSDQRLKELQQMKDEHYQSLFASRQERYEAMRQKLKNAAFMERKRVIRTMMNWNRKERKRKKEEQLRKAHEEEEKNKAIEDKWALRHENQKKQIEKEKYLIECINSRKKKYITEYNEKIQKETIRMQQLLEKMKLFTKCYLGRHLPSGKVRICCKVPPGGVKEDIDHVPKKGKDQKQVSKHKGQKTKKGEKIKETKETRESEEIELIELPPEKPEVKPKKEVPKLEVKEDKEKCRCEMIKAAAEGTKKARLMMGLK